MDKTSVHFADAVQTTQRLLTICKHVHCSSACSSNSSSSLSTSPASSNTTEADSLTITDNRTGKTVCVPIIEKQAVPSLPLWKEFKLRSYDPGYMNTAVCRSAITYIDGEAGVLRYRGYSIEDLVGNNCSFLEVAFLLINGELPNRREYLDWEKKIMTHTYLHVNLVNHMEKFRYDAHPMGMMVSTVGALSTFYPEANAALSGNEVLMSDMIRNKQIYRILGKMPTIAAAAYRHRIGRPYNNPLPGLGYIENFLFMMDHLEGDNYKPHPVLTHALNVLFILHADHELNCSTAAMRHVGSALSDPYTCVAAAISALYGPLHGGANEAVLRMLERIKSKANVPKFLEDVKARKEKLMGFGHRVYKNYDPRARIIKDLAYQVFKVCGYDELIEVATELEAQALKDNYFVERKLFPNVDFYSGLIYKAMGFPTDMFPVLFCIPRAVGWLAHWLELLDDTETKIIRPRQVYTGPEQRQVEPIDARPPNRNIRSQAVYWSKFSARRYAALKWNEGKHKY